ncbi:MAG: LPP20 family lipoprotein [Treponema sp.]|nr:LPP20 family lipoprotein [Treponema sp.]
MKIKACFLLVSGFIAALSVSCATQQSGGASQEGTDKPEWVDAPSSVYPEKAYISATGGGKDRGTAENNAKAALVSYFKQSVSSKISITDTERQSNGRSVSSSSDMSQSTEAVAALDTLIGVEIKNVWNDTKTRTGWWAVAVMEKASGRERYTAELDKTISEINTLIDISNGVSFESIAKCRAAVQLLPKAEVSALVLSMLEGPNRQPEITALASEAAVRLEQAKAIPIDVRVTGDIDGRIKASFAKAFTDLGFRTGNQNSRFALEVTVNINPAEKNTYYNTRYTVDAVLKDAATGAELFTYNIANREAHPASQAEANNRAVLGALKKIDQEFAEVLQGYLNSN